MKTPDEIILNSSARYSREHIWAIVEDLHVVIGITDYAQGQLGEIIYVELPEPEAIFDRDEVFGFVESVKTASDLCSPVSGTIVAVNPLLADSPELVNSKPYEEGWMIKVLLMDATELDMLLAPGDYLDLVSPNA